MPKIFISYRRDDSAGHTGRIHDRLLEYYGADDLFIDVDTIEPGLDFVQVVQEAVNACDRLIAVIGREWLEIAGAGGARRLDDAQDLVRVEIATALDRGIPVIPVLVQGAGVPTTDDLPDVLKRLGTLNALEISDTRFHSDMSRLIGVLGPISPEHAQVAAMRAVQERPGLYGNRYRDVPMTFGVVDSHETEDHYLVTLSFRPQGRTTGDPGLEQVNVGKDGTVLSRQVISLPRGAGTLRRPVVLAGIGVLAVVAAVAVIGTVVITGVVGTGDSRGLPSAGASDPTATATPMPSPKSTPTPNLTSTRRPTPKAISTVASTSTLKGVTAIEPSGVCSLDRFAGSGEMYRPPNVFVGTVAVNGQPARDGTVVAACTAEDRQLIGETTTKGGHYSLTGRFASKDGSRVIFRVGTSDAHQSVEVRPGAITSLDLTDGPITNRVYIPALEPRPVDRIKGQVASLDDNLISIWNHNNRTKEWTWYHPRPELRAYSTLSQTVEGSIYLVILKDSQTAFWYTGGQQQLFEGWTFIRWGRRGFPGESPCPTMDIKLVQAAISEKNDNLLTVWEFDPAVQHDGPDFGWFLYDSRPGFADANTLSKLISDHAYWVRVKQDQIVRVGPQEWDLYAGWNLLLWDCG